MRDREVLLINDVEACVQRLSPLGQAVVGPSARNIADAVAEHCQRRGWTIVPYEAFAKWALEAIRADGGRWVILDPLFPASGQPCTVTLRLSRHADANQPTDTRRRSFHPGSELGHVGLLDDGASTGRTLARAAQVLAAHGGSIRRIVLCAATRAARNRPGCGARPR